MTKKFPLKKSFVAFLDILNFSKRFAIEKDSCIELISFFAEHNGIHFDTVSSNKREIRVSALAFSDNIAISIPVELDSKLHTNEWYEPLMSFLHAISFFSFKTLEKGFYIRGAIAYGDIYHTTSVIAGEPFIEAAKNEKSANYPRIILAPSAIETMEWLYKQHFYGWSTDKIRDKLKILPDNTDNQIYFDWLHFYKNFPESNLSNNKQLEINSIINATKINLEKELSSTDEVYQKLNWMKNYLNYRSFAHS